MRLRFSGDPAKTRPSLADRAQQMREYELHDRKLHRTPELVISRIPLADRMEFNSIL